MLAHLDSAEELCYCQYAQSLTPYSRTTGRAGELDDRLHVTDNWIKTILHESSYAA